MTRSKTIILGAILILGTYAFTKTDNYFEIAKNLDIFSTLYKELNTYYVDDIDPAVIIKKELTQCLKAWTLIQITSRIEDG